MHSRRFFPPYALWLWYVVSLPLQVVHTELYYISGDCALIPRQSTNCNQKHGGFWPNLRHFDVTISLFSCRTPLTKYIIGKNHTKT